MNQDLHLIQKQQTKEKSRLQVVDQETTTRTTSISKKYKIILILLVIGAFIAFTAPLASLFFNDSTEIELLRDKHTSLKKKRLEISFTLNKLIFDFEKGEIEEAFFKKESYNLASQHKNIHYDILKSSKVISNFKNKEKYFHFKSFKIFISHLGIITSILLSSFILLTVSLAFINNKKIKRVLNTISVLIMIPAIFYLIWIFHSNNDLDQQYYNYTFILISIGVSIFSFFVYKTMIDVYTKRIDLKCKIAFLLNLISTIRYNHFVKLERDARYKDLTQENIQEETTRLDDTIYTNLKEIL